MNKPSGKVLGFFGFYGAGSTVEEVDGIVRVPLFVSHFEVLLQPVGVFLGLRLGGDDRS